MNALQKIIQKIFNRKAIIPMGGPFAPLTAGKFIDINGQLTWVSDNFESYVVNGYQANDIIYSIINMIMDKIKVAPWSLYKVVDEQALKKYNAALEEKDWVSARKLHTKALEPITKYDNKTGRLKELLQWPNEKQTWNDLVADNSGFVNIVGNNYTYADFLQAGANKGLPGALYNSPAQYMIIKATRTFPQKITGYQLQGGEIRNFTTEEILHERLFNPLYNISGSGLYGMSPIKAAIKTLTRNNSSKKAGATQLDNNGAAGIAYIDDSIVPANGREAQVKAVKQKWNDDYVGADNYGKVAFSGYKMGYVSVGMSLKDMNLTEVEGVDLRILANVWGLPSQLLNDPENKSYNNAKEAEKALTSRCALPRLISMRNNFNRKLQTDWGFKGVNVYAEFDTSVYPELQEDQKEKWEWVKQLPVSGRYKLEMMGLDVPDDPNMDVILVDGKLVPLGDLINNLTDDEMTRVSDELDKAGLKDYLRIAK